MVAQKIPLTYLELTKLAGDELVRFPATFDEYWELLQEAEYKVDFYQNEIIAMSYENDNHSYIVTRFSFLLSSIFFPIKEPSYRVHNPNRPIYVKDCGKHTVFNPDGSVVAQPPLYFEYSPGMNAETTPILLFEVLSKSTRSHDFGTKLPCYKQIPSLNTILYIETTKPSVIVMERKSANQWIETELKKMTDSFIIEGKKISLQDIYAEIVFEKKK